MKIGTVAGERWQSLVRTIWILIGAFAAQGLTLLVLDLQDQATHPIPIVRWLFALGLLALVVLLYGLYVWARRRHFGLSSEQLVKRLQQAEDLQALGRF